MDNKNKKIVVAIVTLIISILIAAISCALGIEPNDIVDNLPDTSATQIVSSAAEGFPLEATEGVSGPDFNIA